ncbi:MAG: FAD-dependent oxidoreductase [Desulfatiglandaceae bacterium]
MQKADKAPCRYACPAGLNVQGYVQMIGAGKYDAALKIIMEDLPLPGVLGRICPHPCEEACRRLEVDSAVAIRDLKRLAADMGDMGDVLFEVPDKRPERVAIVGAGPAGLTAGYHLARRGISSTIFEALPVAGGMLRVGIPDHRLPPEVLDREIEVIRGLGVDMEFGKRLGKDFTVDSLLQEGYSAVYLAVGAHLGMNLSIPGEESDGVRQGVDFLRELNLEGRVSVGSRVAVIGGGNVAIDVARSAVRLGAEEVTIVYRRTRAEMPAWEEEICVAEAEGVKLVYLAAPVEVLSEGGKVTGLKCIRMELGEPDASGRRRPVPIEGSEYDIEIDQLIPAIGQRPDLSGLSEAEGFSFTRWGTIEADDVSFQTSRPEVFAGGDAVSGPWLAIGAVSAGKEAAESIRRYLDGEDLKAGREKKSPDSQSYRPLPAAVERRERARVRELPVSERSGNFNEVELGLDPEDGQAEAARCLNCGYCCECYQCVEACGPGAVTLDTHRQQPETVSLNVGSVILAPGFQPFDPTGFDTYSYAKHPNVLTAMEFERILSASGPTMGHLLRMSDQKEPKKIAWLQCVGSRDLNRCDNSYCSSVCCMYAIKQAVIAKEHAGDALDCTVFYMDMRTHGKDFERYFEDARNKHGVQFVRSRVHTVDPIPRSEDLSIRYVDETGEMRTETFDMVVLSVGMETSAEVKALAERLGILLGEGGFCDTSSFRPVSTSREGLFACGAFQGPKDIPQSVVEASSAAAEAGALLKESRNTLTKTAVIPEERNIRGERPHIGVFICQCGINIGGVVDVAAVRDYAASLPYVEYVADNLYTCSQDTQEIMTGVIKEHNLNRIVVAACTPKTHEPLFQETLVNAGLNKYLFEMTNIRNQDSWVHRNNPDAATEKAKDLVRMAVAKVALSEPLEEAELKVNPNALVIGGGIAGLTAARSLSAQGYGVSLVERDEELGGQALRLFRTWKGEDVGEGLLELVDAVNSDPNIEVLAGASIEEVEGFVGNFKTTVQLSGAEKVIEHGVAVLATGASEYKPKEYLYGEDSRVLTHLELDSRFLAGGGSLNKMKSVVFIQCVGSREPERPYCSRVCCTHSIESALHLKELNPEMNIYILNRDIRTYGEREYLYKKARESGIIFIQFSTDAKPVVRSADHALEIDLIDPVLGVPLAIEADMLILATAITPYKDENLARFFKVALNQDGFFIEKHAKLGPSEFATDGVYLCGTAHYPKSIDESVAQALAAASRATALLSKGTVHFSGTVAGVNPAACTSCGICIEICPYSAPSFRQDGPFAGSAEINPALCKGCGLCVASCRSGAINLKGFDHDQIMAMINEM